MKLGHRGYATLPGMRSNNTPLRRSRLTEEVVHAGTRAGRDGVVGAIPYLAVLGCAAAGVYIAWNSGPQGGGQGGVIVGSALLAAAVARLVLPARLVSLLASRHRVTDAATLTVFGAGLLVAGLVLPR
jgi:hypothetical protein